MNRDRDGYPCPCCGYRVFAAAPGSHQVCPVCHWEDNLVQLRFPTMPGAANIVSLRQGQENFAAFGACERRFVDAVRGARSSEPRDEEWRRLDPARDNPEVPRRGVHYADSYPEVDPTVLYYWRASYWRRLSS